MQRPSATLEGFKTIFRQPSLGFAEIAWRWSLAFGGFVLTVLTLSEYLNTLPVTADDLSLFRSRQPALIGRALQHVFRGSSARILEAGFVLGLAYVVAWIVVASIGRAITLRALLADMPRSATAPKVSPPGRLSSLVALHALRVTALFTAFGSILGAFVMASAASSAKHPGVLAAGLITVLVVASPVCLVLNWLLSLASIFTVSEGKSAFCATKAAAVLCRDHVFAVVAASFWFGVARLTFFFVVTIAITLSLALFAVAPPTLVITGIVVFSALYLAIADFLYIGRLAAYLFIATGPETVAAQPLSPEPRGFTPPSSPVPKLSGIDQEELILSDLSPT